MTDIQADRASLRAEAAPPEAPWSTVAAPDETGALIDHILKRFHESHRRELPELLRLARRVESLHGADSAAPIGLAGLLERIQGALVTHMTIEELVVFPRMRRAAAAPLDRPLIALHAQHDDQASLLRALGTLTNDFTCPKGAGREWRGLCERLEKFAGDLAEHVRLEEDVLFPRFDAQRGPSASLSTSGD